MPVTQAAAASRTLEVPPIGTAARTSATVLREAQLTSTSGGSRTPTTPADPQDTPTVISTSIPTTATSTSTPTASPLPTLESIPTATELVEPTPDFPDLGDSEATEEPGGGRRTTVTVLGGSGSAVTEPVWLEAGLVALRLYQNGSAGAEFRVVSTQTGAEVDRVAVTSGVQVAGSGFAIEAAREYAIDVTGDSEWTINLVPPIAEQAIVEGLPWEWADTGPQVFYFIELPGGRHTIMMPHAGGAAVVELLPVSGASLVLQVEADSGPLAVEGPSGGLFAVVVTASDSWSLTVE